MPHVALVEVNDSTTLRLYELTVGQKKIVSSRIVAQRPAMYCRAVDES
jgi:hypothetical protein